MNKISRLSHSLFVIVLSLSLVVINIIRIFKVPITIDETGYNTVDSYKDLITESYPSANNHIFHSVVRKFFIETFSNDPFFYRLDSLLAQIVYLVFVFLICRMLFKSRWWEIVSFIVLSTLSPLIFNFWGLSRGYADGMCFMTISIYYLLTYQDSGKSKYLVFSFLAGVFSVWSNFGLINYFIGLCGVVFITGLLFHLNRPKTFGKQMLVLLGGVAILAALVTKPLMVLHGDGELNFLGKGSFLEETVNSLSQYNQFLPDCKDPMIFRVSYTVVALTLIIGVYWTVRYFQKRYFRNDTETSVLHGYTLSLLLTIPCVSLILQHNFFGINYLIDRTALFFVILFTIQLIYFLYFIRERIPYIGDGVFLILSVFVVWNFTIHLNFRDAFIWWFDADDVHAVEKIISEPHDTNRKLKLGLSWQNVGGVRYAINKYYKDDFLPITEGIHIPCTDSSYDYIYMEVGQVDKIPAIYKRDTTFVRGLYVLLKRQ